MSLRHHQPIDCIQQAGIRIPTAMTLSILVPSLTHCARQGNRLCTTDVKYYICIIRLVFLPVQITLLIMPVFSNRFEQRYDNGPPDHLICGIVIHIGILFDVPSMARLVPCTKPPRPHINKKLTSFNKSTTLSEKYHLSSIDQQLYERSFIFTDGLKSEDLVRCAYIVRKRHNKYRLHSLTSVYTALSIYNITNCHVY